MRKEVFTSTALSIISTTIHSIYMLTLHVPSRLSAIPSIKEMDGFWTAFLSGELGVWMYYHHPLAGVGLYFMMWFVVFFLWMVGTNFFSQ